LLAPAIVALAAPARAEPPPLRIDYAAAEGCPAAEGLLEEIRWRTSLARVAAPGEDAMLVEARITKHGALHRGRLVLRRGHVRIARALESERCDEVISAFALITALAIDPRASTAVKRPAAPPPPPPPPSPRPLPPAPLPPPPPPFAPQIVPDPLPAVAPWPATAAPSIGRWLVGARVAAAFAVAPRPLFGGEVLAERAFAGGASLRMGIEIGATGAFQVDLNTGGAWFLRAVGRVEGCAFALRSDRFAAEPCLALEGGVLHGQGIAGGSVTTAQAATVPWFAGGLLPRLTADLGPVVLEAQGGPVLPFVRRTFVFGAVDNPSTTIHEVPPVTGFLSLGASLHFP
jgi:hypothetical protein